MRSRDRETSPPPHSDEQLDRLVRRILTRTLDKFDDARGPHSADDTSKDHPRDIPPHNELARLVLGQVAQFAVNRYLKSKQKKASKASKAKKQTSMPFLFGDGGRPLRSGERERMQRRRETGRSTPYDGSQEIHLTDPLPPEPVPVTVVPPRDPPPPEPKLRRRRRHHNLSGREPADPPSTRPPLVIPPSPEDRPLPTATATPTPIPIPSLPRSFTWDSPPVSRSPYAHHPNYPMHDAYGAYDPPVSTYRPRDREYDAEREQRRRDREYDKERRQRKEAERERPREPDRHERKREREKEKERDGRDRERISVERSREAALALSIDDLLKQLRSTDDLVYRTVYRPTVERYDERRAWERRDRDRDRERCSCRAIIMQSADLQRSLARSRSAALSVRDLLDMPLLDDRRRRRPTTVHFEGM